MIATVFITLQYGRIRHERHWHYRRIQPIPQRARLSDRACQKIFTPTISLSPQAAPMYSAESPPFWTNTPVPAWRSPRVRMSCSSFPYSGPPLPQSFRGRRNLLFEKTGCVNGICFGAESGDLALLRRIADVLADEPADLKASLKYNLKSGSTFPKAREAALLSYFPAPPVRMAPCPYPQRRSPPARLPEQHTGSGILKSAAPPRVFDHALSAKAGRRRIPRNIHPLRRIRSPASASAIRHTLFADAAGACGILPTGHLKILPTGFCVMPCRRKHWPSCRTTGQIFRCCAPMTFPAS